MLYRSASLGHRFKHPAQRDILGGKHFGDQSHRTKIEQELLDENGVVLPNRASGSGHPIEFDNGALDLAFGQALVVEPIEEGDDVQNFGSFFLEFEEVQLLSRRSHLQDQGHFRGFTSGHQDRIADLFPNIHHLEGIQLEQVAPLTPGAGRDMTLILETAQAIVHHLGHRFVSSRDSAE